MHHESGTVSVIFLKGAVCSSPALSRDPCQRCIDNTWSYKGRCFVVVVVFNLLFFVLNGILFSFLLKISNYDHGICITNSHPVLDYSQPNHSLCFTPAICSSTPYRLLCLLPFHCLLVFGQRTPEKGILKKRWGRLAKPCGCLPVLSKVPTDRAEGACAHSSLVILH